MNPSVTVGRGMISKRASGRKSGALFLGRCGVTFKSMKLCCPLRCSPEEWNAVAKERKRVIEPFGSGMEVTLWFQLSSSTVSRQCR